MTTQKRMNEFTKEYIEILLRYAYMDMNFLLQEGFDTNAMDCEIDGVKGTLIEIRRILANDSKFQAYLEETKNG